MGILLSCTIILAWLASLAVAFRLPAPLVHGLRVTDLLLFLWLEFLFVGLFITAHDACHGSLAPGRAKVNLWLGRLSAFLYAGFFFDAMRTKHADHHRNPGSELDPDFLVQEGKSGSYFHWILRFFRNYLTLWQVLTMTLLAQFFLHVLHIPEPNVFFFWVAPSLLSAVQLFTFGTYLPHRTARDGEFVDSHRARNTAQGFLHSLVTCYHFGAWHLHHHREPSLPWYHLPHAGKYAAKGVEAEIEVPRAPPIGLKAGSKQKIYLSALIFFSFFCRSPISSAHPVAYKDAVGVMTWNQSFMTDDWITYSFRPDAAFAARHMRMEMPDGRMQFYAPQLDYLVKRWNKADSQANIYIYGAYGANSFRGKTGGAGLAGTEMDAESRKLFVSGKYERMFARIGPEFYRAEARIGIAPYEAEFSEIASWFMLQYQYHPSLTRKHALTPLVRLFYRSVLFEAGVSTDADWMVNFMFHF